MSWNGDTVNHASMLSPSKQTNKQKTNYSIRNLTQIHRFLLISALTLCLLQFNFVGKLLGPRGNSLKRLQEDTLTKMSILGKGSMRDKEKVTLHSATFLVCFFPLPFHLSPFTPPYHFASVCCKSSTQIGLCLVQL